ncbi:MAG: mRNA-degrading endonuclease [Azospirillum sp.]|nr:mRNA-degrading endonuclease [Azospirillum sp.]
MTDGYVPDRGDVIRLAIEQGAAGAAPDQRRAVVLSPRSYNDKARLALVCPLIARANGHPFEVGLPDGLAVRGAVLADQVRSLDWMWRQAKPIGRLPPEVVATILARLGALLQP